MFKTWKRTSLVVIEFIQCHDKCIEGIFSVYTQQKHTAQLLSYFWHIRFSNKNRLTQKGSDEL